MEIDRYLKEEDIKQITQKEQMAIESITKSLTSLGCRVKTTGSKWHIIDSLGGKFTADNLNDLKLTEEFIRRVFYAITNLKSSGYRVKQKPDGWEINNIFEGSRKVNSVFELEKFAVSKLKT